MRTVKVTLSTAYEVKIGANLLEGLGAECARVCRAERCAIVSDSHVWPLYGGKAEESLKAAGIEPVHFVFPAGEDSKNGSVYLKLLNFLAENGMARSDCLIALGGGVVGDMTGFAAATYLRGVAYIQVPTTLLAAVDSSVGGKTGIDLLAGKNLCGAFYQPRLVLCDTETLNTLPADVFRDGCAEVIKYGVLYDPELLACLTEAGMGFDREAVIARCVELKRDAVEADEFDTGARMKLNLGHTVGHGIEAASDFAVSHGKAVAMGMAIVSRACRCTDGERIIACLEKFGLPTATEFPAEEICRYALLDKKRSGGTVKLILPKAIGDCAIVATPVERLKALIEEGL